MKLAFVLPRYGAEVVGGAETAARMLAERLVATRGWPVEVLTTCARDAMTWEDEYRPGETVEGGVTVRRWRSVAGRDPGFHPYSGRLLQAPEAASRAEADRWIDLQGPLCPDVVAAAEASDADVVAFYPYLYYPTVRGLPLVGGRAVLHAAAHDEAPLRLPVFRDVFASAGGLVFHTHGERRLVHGLFGLAHRPQVVLGLGIDQQPGDGAAGQAALGLGERPYVCCIGRVDDQKGCGLLARYFLTYKERRPGPLALAFVGQVVDRPPVHPDIVVTGPVGEPAKWGILEGATALVSPSAMESFSLVMIEGWSAGVPAVVNGACLATREHCERSGGGLWFSGYAQFEGVLDRLLADPGLRRTLAERGQTYVDANFRWPVVLDRYQRFLLGVGRPGVPPRLRPASTMPGSSPRRGQPEGSRPTC
ncbi:MAG: glycosyltransferase family 4 protein [Acidimicrobiales bacterium]